MGSNGQVLARRAGTPGVLTRGLSRRSADMPAPLRAAFNGPVTMSAFSGERPGTGLMWGLDTINGSSKVSARTYVGPDGDGFGMRVIPAADIKRMAGLIESGTQSAPGTVGPLARAANSLASLRESAAPEARSFGFLEAADFAGKVEEVARVLEYLQVVAAQAVERTRNEAQNAQRGSSSAAPEWRTGWAEPAVGADNPVDSVALGAAQPGAAMGTYSAAQPGAATGTHSAATPGAAAWVAGSAGAAKAGSPASPLDDGYRNAAEFLRARLRISISEARRRLALANDVLPQTGMTGQHIPARREILADAHSSALLPSRSATIISAALDKTRHLTDDDTITLMEQALTTTAKETDPDFVAKMAKAWSDRIDQDGPEPSEEALRQLQGAFLRRRRRHGLHHLEIFATDEQIETLTTAMNTATNPRLTTPEPSHTTEPSDTTEPGHTPDDGTPTGTTPTGTGTHAAAHGPTGPDLDRRTRAQKLLNGLVGACALAMSTGKLPSNGGLRPQLTVTIDHRHLFEQLTHHNKPNHTGHTGTGPNPLSSGTATFTGPLHPNTIRKIACDADIIPVLLGSQGRVLDIG
ncbi:protein of unknown function, partial [Arthrobacter sp. cf158]|uniref:DUF222 domain-containing protein n=1 Tax=Arthrobacter sp. cf158 TaxID=1761744 RepID=UPI00089C58D2